jgi:putative phosphoribosyl transferase
LATLLFDLLTNEEESIDRRTSKFRFDIPLLAGRLVDVTQWATRNTETRSLAVGYFGASTGAAAALVAAARLPGLVDAVVSRGGRPDLAGEDLGFVQASTLLIVGGLDDVVLGLNRMALDRLRCPNKRLAIVPSATHLFEEPGALEEAARLAAQWLVQYVGQSRRESKITA